MAKIEAITREEIRKFDNEIIDNCVVKRLKDTDKDNFGQDKEFGRIHLTGNNQNLINKIVELIKSSSEIICLSSFIFTEEKIIEALLEKARKNVRIYILTAPEKQLEKENKLEDIKREDIEKHKKVLNMLAYSTLIRTAPHFHSKFIIVDPKTTNARGFLTTANFVRSELTRNPDLGILLTKEEVGEIFKQFIYAFWFESEREVLEKGILSAVSKPPYQKEDIQLPTKIPVTMDGVNGIRDAIERLLAKAKIQTDEIIISTFTIIKNHKITSILCDKLEKGIKISIFTRFRKANATALIELRKKGAKIYIHDKIHAKCVIVKSQMKESIVMTANISDLGLDSGFETAIKLNEKDTDELLKIINIWRENFPYELETNKSIGKISSNLVKSYMNEKILDIKIENKKEMDLGKINADSIENMENTKPKEFPKPHKKGIYYRECIYRWTVTPPKLPKKAKKIEINKKIPFPIFEFKKEKYLVIEDTKDDLKKARKIASELQAKIVTKDS
ncbi:MAG: phospholipase D-like domain-containing protein [Candidatus Heimdallarchaeaceae archaeon]